MPEKLHGIWKGGTMKNTVILTSLLFILSCSFDYGETESSEIELPNLIMENVEYVRVRSADPVARIQAERVERYERQRLMKMQNFSFEQYEDRGEEINIFGKAGSASFNTTSGDIFMDGGVRLEIESEDIIIETNQIEWKDEQKILTSGEEDEVNIFQQNGSSITGVGLRIDIRRRYWEFLGPVFGTYIHEDDANSTLQP
jgi:LPS export ABC transporter protein LptC